MIEKWYNRWLDLLTSMVLLGPDLHCRGPLILWDFRNIFLAHVGEGQINVLSSDRETPGTAPYRNPALVIALCS